MQYISRVFTDFSNKVYSINSCNNTACSQEQEQTNDVTSRRSSFCKNSQQFHSKNQMYLSSLALCSMQSIWCASLPRSSLTLKNAWDKWTNSFYTNEGVASTLSLDAQIHYTDFIKMILCKKDIINDDRYLPLSKYINLGLIGRGGQGYVFKAYDTESKKFVAIKIGFFKRSQEQKYFVEQQKMFSSIKSFEHIIKTYDWIVTEQLYVQIMELFDTNLHDLCLQKKKSNDPFIKQEVQSFCFQLITGMIEFHAQNIHHKDIKPLNILINLKTLELKFTDFGSSFQLNKENEGCHFGYRGTPQYSSPEDKQLFISQRNHENTSKLHPADKRSDVYCMGLTILQIIGVDLSDQNLNDISVGEWKNIKYNLQYQSIFTFVKDFMLSTEVDKRLIAIKLHRFFVDYFNFDLNAERQRILNLILKYKNDHSDESQKYIAFLYCLLGQLENDCQNQNDYYKQSYNFVIKRPGLFEWDERIHIFNMYGTSLLKIQQFKEGKAVIKMALKELILKKKKDRSKKVLLDISEVRLYLADAYYFLGRPNRSYREHKISYNIRKIKLKLSDDNPLIIQSKYNLALIESHRGYFSTAYKLDYEVLQIRLQVFKGDHPDIAFGYNSFGVACFLLGMYEEAHKNFLLSSEMIQNVYLFPHQTVAQMKNNFGISLEKQNKLDDAFKEKQEAYKIRIQIYKCPHQDIASSLNSLGIIFEKQHKHNQSKEHFEKSLEMLKNLYERNHPLIAKLLTNLAIYYQLRQKNKKSHKLFERALEMRRKIFWDDHPDVLCSMFNLANSHIQIGEREIGIKIHNQIEGKVNQLKQESNFYKDYFDGNNLSRFEECFMYNQPYLRR